MSAIELVDLHKKNLFLVIQIADSFLIIFRPIIFHKFHVSSADVKKLCLLCSQKLTDKYSQALVCWCTQGGDSLTFMTGVIMYISGV